MKREFWELKYLHVAKVIPNVENFVYKEVREISVGKKYLFKDNAKYFIATILEVTEGYDFSIQVFGEKPTINKNIVPRSWLVCWGSFNKLPYMYCEIYDKLGVEGGAPKIKITEDMLEPVITPKPGNISLECTPAIPEYKYPAEDGFVNMKLGLKEVPRFTGKTWDPNDSLSNAIKRTKIYLMHKEYKKQTPKKDRSREGFALFVLDNYKEDKK